MIPTRALFLALLAPQLLALTVVFEPSLLGGMLALDGVILLAALIDAASVLKPPLEVERSLPDIVSLSRPFGVEVTVKNPGRRDLWLQVKEEWSPAVEVEGLPAPLFVPAGSTRRLRYRARASVRGEQTVHCTWVRVPSAGGFWLRQLSLPGPDRIRVYPDVQAIRHWELRARQNRDPSGARLARLRGGDTEFERLRDYQRDDEVRRIDWKATARRQRLTVRDYQLEQNQSVMVLLDCGRTMLGEWDGISAFDHALNATLMLAHVAARRGDRVGLTAIGERVERYLPPTGGRSAANRMIRATYDLFPQLVEPDYGEATRFLRAQVPSRTLVVLITHALDETAAERLKTLTRDLMPRHLPLVVVLRDADVDHRLHREAESPIELGAQAAAAEMTLWWEELSLQLSRSGVLVLDTLHRQLTGALLARYLEIKTRGLL